MSFTSKRWGDDSPRDACEHAGLFLLKGFHYWDAESADGQSKNTAEQHNKCVVEHHQTAAKILPALYAKAYDRWKTHLLELGHECGHWFGDLVGRMYLGLGEASPLEAGITLHHTYGVPMIPGSAVKGVLHHYALQHWDDTALIELIFGREPDPAKEDGGDAGRVIFNDAWWVIKTSKPEACNDKPLVAEVITVHHPNYYSKGGEIAATDFDDPNPNSQIAIQGGFHFSFFADDALHEVVQALLRDALTQMGIGAKTSSGYGLFREDQWKTNEMKAKREEVIKQQELALKQAQMSPLQIDIEEIEEKEKNNPAAGLFQALENKRWSDPKDMDTVARRIQSLLEAEGKWTPNFSGTNKNKLKLKERCLRVMGFIIDKSS